MKIGRSQASYRTGRALQDATLQDVRRANYRDLPSVVIKVDTACRLHKLLVLGIIQASLILRLFTRNFNYNF